MYLMIDNYDSFVYNLKAYFEELGRDVRVKRCDELTLADIEHMELEGIILSPGPKRPQDAALCMQVVQRFGGKIPILGVCLGHSHARASDQIISSRHRTICRTSLLF